MFSANQTGPIFDYKHGPMGRAVAGGVVYRGCLSPSFNGVYFFGDHSLGVSNLVDRNVF